MSYRFDAEARGISRQVRSAVQTELDRYDAQSRDALRSCALTNPTARKRWLTRMVNADPSLFLAIDRAKRSREIEIFMAWFVVAQAPQRLAIGSRSIRGSVRRGDFEYVRELDLCLSAHAQERLVRRLGLHTPGQQLDALKRIWFAMFASYCATMARLMRERGRVLDGPDDAKDVGIGGVFYVPCGAGESSVPPTGLAVVAFPDPFLAEVVTVLDRDQLNDGEQQTILNRWKDWPAAAPLLGELEARRHGAEL